MSQGIFLAQMAVIAVMLIGDKLFELLAVPPPALYLQYKDKRFAIIMACWFLGNMVHNGLTATGAFEVFYDGSQVHLLSQAGKGYMDFIARPTHQVVVQALWKVGGGTRTSSLTVLAFCAQLSAYASMPESLGSRL